MQSRLSAMLVAAGLGMMNASDVLAQSPVGTGLSYQGQLKVADQPANGTYDFIFELVNSAGAGNLIGQQDVITGVPVVDGLFTVELNSNGEFGPDAFNGDARWLQVRV